MRTMLDHDQLQHVVASWETQGPRSPIAVTTMCGNNVQVARNAFSKRDEQAPPTTCFWCAARMSRWT